MVLCFVNVRRYSLSIACELDAKVCVCNGIFLRSVNIFNTVTSNTPKAEGKYQFYKSKLILNADIVFYNCIKGMSEVAKCSHVNGRIECVKEKTNDTTRLYEVHCTDNTNI
jgi:hypothetical protein